MEGIGLLAIPVWIGMVICFIMVLIKMFQNEGALKGIIGLICSLYAFVWGWMNASRFGLKNIMIIWTVCLVLYFIIFFAAGGASMYGAR